MCCVLFFKKKSMNFSFDCVHQLYFQAAKGGLVMINFFSYFITCSNLSSITDVIGKQNLDIKTFIYFDKI